MEGKQNFQHLRFHFADSTYYRGPVKRESNHALFSLKKKKKKEKSLTFHIYIGQQITYVF